MGTAAWTVSTAVLALIALSALWCTATMVGSVLGNLSAAAAGLAVAVAAVAVPCSVGLIAACRRTALRPSTVGLTVVLVAVTHLALEVHSRYHASVVPLLCLLAAGGVEASPPRRAGELTSRLANRDTHIRPEVPP